MSVIVGSTITSVSMRDEKHYFSRIPVSHKTSYLVHYTWEPQLPPLLMIYWMILLLIKHIFYQTQPKIWGHWLPCDISNVKVPWEAGSPNLGIDVLSTTRIVDPSLIGESSPMNNQRLLLEHWRSKTISSARAIRDDKDFDFFSNEHLNASRSDLLSECVSIATSTVQSRLGLLSQLIFLRWTWPEKS